MTIYVVTVYDADGEVATMTAFRSIEEAMEKAVAWGGEIRVCVLS